MNAQATYMKYNQLGQSAAQLPVTHPSPQKKHTVPKGERTNAVKKTNATAAAKEKNRFFVILLYSKSVGIKTGFLRRMCVFILAEMCECKYTPRLPLLAMRNACRI